MKTMNKIEWIVIPAPDLIKAKDFYADIFGWKIGIFTADFWLFDADTIRGGFDPKLKPGDKGIRFSITVDNIEETLFKIADKGGIIVKEKTAIASGYGFFAQFNDPNGNLLELWAEK